MQLLRNSFENESPFLAAGVKSTAIMQAPATIMMTNMPAPRREPIASFATSGSGLVKATIDAKISAAPPPKATRVTPATLSDRRSCVAIFVKVGTKNASAASPRQKQRYRHQSV